MEKWEGIRWGDEETDFTDFSALLDGMCHLMSCSLDTQPYVITFISAGQDKLTLIHGVLYTRCSALSPSSILFIVSYVKVH